MTDKKIKLYKQRDFGAKINITIEYIRSNFGPLMKTVLLIVIPIGLLFSTFFSSIFSSFFALSANPQLATDPAGIEALSALGTNYILIIVLSMVTYSFLLAVVFTFLKMRDEMENPPEVLEVIKAALPKVGGLLVLMIITAVLSGFGLILFVLPGIYMAIVLALSYPIYVFEDGGIGAAFSKSFKLIRGKWWSTFGLLIIMSIMASVVSYVFAIPYYATVIANIFSMASEGQQPDPDQFLQVFSSWYSTVSLAILMMGSYLTYTIPILALAFQYFNLSERFEGKGIRKEISDFENLD